MKRTSYIDYSAVKQGRTLVPPQWDFCCVSPPKLYRMWPSGTVDNPKSITHDVGPRSLQDEMELTSNRRDMPLCLAASYPPCSFNVACGGLVLLAAQSMSTMCSRLHAQTVGILINKSRKIHWKLKENVNIHYGIFAASPRPSSTDVAVWFCGQPKVNHT